MLGTRIRQARKQKGLTQEGLAALVGVKRSVISKYESGAIEPSISQLRRIGGALDVSVGYLQGEETMDAAQLLEAMRRADYETAARLMGLEPGALQPIPAGGPELPEGLARPNSSPPEQDRDGGQPPFASRDDPDCRTLLDAFSQLNPAGRQKALERVGELAQLPQYQKKTLPGR